MKIGERTEGTAVVLSPSGRLDVAGAPAVEEKIAAAAAPGPDRVVLDCSGVGYISSAGLRAMLLGARACLQHGCELAIAALTPECRSILDATGLLMVLDCHDTVEAALDAPGAPGRTTRRTGPRSSSRSGRRGGRWCSRWTGAWTAAARRR